jgi:hypothetical protein
VLVVKKSLRARIVAAEKEGDIIAAEAVSSNLDAVDGNVPDEPMELSEDDIPRRTRECRRKYWLRPCSRLL